MNELTEDKCRQIEQIHSRWIEFELTGANHNVMTLCADDVELFPPDKQPVCGPYGSCGAVGNRDKKNSQH